MQLFKPGTARRRASFLLACLSAWVGIISASGSLGVASAEITTFQDYYAWQAKDAGQGTPIRISGTVVCYDQGWNQLYIYDGSQTAWFSPTLFQTNLQAGCKVELTGAASAGKDGVVATNLHLQVLSEGKLPPAKNLGVQQLGSDFGQWVQTRGIVRMADNSRGRPCLIIQDHRKTCNVYVMGPDSTNNEARLRGCDVRIQGINASKAVNGQLTSPCVYAANWNAISVLAAPGTNSPALPVTSIEGLLNRELGPWTNDPVHLNGVIVSITPGESLVVRDATGSIRVRIIQATGAEIDTRADVWGYLTVLPGETLLQDGYFEIPPPPAAKGPPAVTGRPADPAATHPDELTRFSEIATMGRETAAQGFWARLKGTVIYADSDWRNCFIQGLNGAIYVNLNQSDIKAGQWVEVSGQTSPGGFAPELVNTRIRVLAETNLPVPVKTDLEDLASGNLDSHWVQLDGVVRRATEQWGHLTLLLTTPKGSFKAIVLTTGLQPAATNLVDALVSVRGACTSEMNARGQLTGIILHVPGLDKISVVEPVPPDPFAVPATLINAVATFDPDRLAGRRVKVSGTVTLVLPGQGFYVQDASGGIRVEQSQIASVHKGDTVNVLGFPAISDFSPYLEEVSVQITAAAPLPKPQPTTADDILLNGAHDATLVQIDAQLVQSIVRSAHPKLVLQSGSIIFAATLAAPTDRIPNFEIGSWLRVAGVCSIQGGENHEPETFRLLVAEPRDITLLRSPPRWTIRHTLMLAASLTLSVLLAWGWSSSLRRQVRAQTNIIRRNEQELMTVSRQAGMAEVATAVLHNVGNVLNSVNVSATLAAEGLRDSRSGDVALVAAMMKENSSDLGQFLAHDPKGRQIPQYLVRLGEQLAGEKRFLLGELESLTKNIHHIKNIVAMQQSYARVSGVLNTISVADLIENALQMTAGGLDRHDIQIVRDFGAAGSLEITVEENKVLQILVNLISNAKDACAASEQTRKLVTIRVTSDENRVKIACTDNGVGIPPENMTRIFAHGFTTRKNGHGFGLHSAALAAKELGGTLQAASEGPGQGATFSLDLPRSPLPK